MQIKTSPFLPHDEDPSATEQKRSKAALPFAPTPSAFTYWSCVCMEPAKPMLKVN
jgi:hypothetical protein